MIITGRIPSFTGLQCNRREPVLTEKKTQMSNLRRRLQRRSKLNSPRHHTAHFRVVLHFPSKKQFTLTPCQQQFLVTNTSKTDLIRCRSNMILSGICHCRREMPFIEHFVLNLKLRHRYDNFFYRGRMDDMSVDSKMQTYPTMHPPAAVGDRRRPRSDTLNEVHNEVHNLFPLY